MINTHVHFDPLLGNAEFSAGHPMFLGHADLPVALAASREYFLQDFANELAGVPAAPAIVPPDHTVDDELRLDIGGRERVLVAHTHCDRSVFDQKISTLGAGDLVFADWLRWMDDNEARPNRRVVPGHGSTALAWPEGAHAQHA